MRPMRRMTTRRMVMMTNTITTLITTTLITAMIITTTTDIIMTSTVVTTITTAIPMLMKINEPPREGAGGSSRADAAGEVSASSAAGLPDNEAKTLYRLMTWLSPSFPVGAFSYSSGIEWAVEAGDITDAVSLRRWLASMLADGSGLCDGIFLVQTHQAVSSGDDAGLAGVAELASAFVTSRERHLETTAQGRAFIEIARAAWSCGSLDRLIAACGVAIVYPVAVGLVSAAHALPLAPTVHGFLHAVISNWISAGARLVPLGQTDS